MTKSKFKCVMVVHIDCAVLLPHSQLQCDMTTAKFLLAIDDLNIFFVMS